MPKRIIKRFSPKPETLQNHPHLKFLGDALLNPNLWHINRKSASAAVAIGLFCAWMPIPFQMVLAATLAIIFSANQPFAVALVWLSNPLTMPPLFYGAYKLGAAILGIPLIEFNFELSFSWIIDVFETIAGPLLLGSFILAFTSSIIGYFAMNTFWRWNVARKWKKRANR
jgi:uncharacterized protein (DUF2062 family)